MGDEIRRGRLSVTSVTSTSVTSGSVDRTEVTVVAHSDSVESLPDASGRDCFDPRSCCDARERELIEVLRSYLRPDVAPECLLRRLRETIDHCCDQEESVRAADSRIGGFPSSGSLV
ncbi:hypothetical protein [uncultured Bifidobacterium sp.]|uniref:hypothetical protein n=1 Tax=uncultured Bifidobacterium sp. TaxID=165187 RepID=UPI0028DCEA87|nr:hypothetical protein [uncultured Bifidobacterium sp.]